MLTSNNYVTTRKITTAVNKYLNLKTIYFITAYAILNILPDFTAVDCPEEEVGRLTA